MNIHNFSMFESSLSLEDAKDLLLGRVSNELDAETLYNWKYYEPISDYLLIKNDMNVKKAYEKLSNIWKHYAKNMYSGIEAYERYQKLDDLLEEGESLPDEVGVFQGSSGRYAGYNLLDGDIYIENFTDERIAALWAVLLIETSDFRKMTEEQFAERYFSNQD